MKRWTRNRDPSLGCVSPSLFLWLHWIAMLCCHPPAPSTSASKNREVNGVKRDSHRSEYMEEKQFRIHSRRRPDRLTHRDSKVSSDTDTCINEAKLSSFLIKSIIRTSTWGWRLFHGNRAITQQKILHCVIAVYPADLSLHDLAVMNIQKKKIAWLIKNEEDNSGVDKTQRQALKRWKKKSPWPSWFQRVKQVPLSGELTAFKLT